MLDNLFAYSVACRFTVTPTCGSTVVVHYVYSAMEPVRDMRALLGSIYQALLARGDGVDDV